MLTLLKSVEKAVLALCGCLLVFWGTLAIYFSNLPSSTARAGVAAAFALFALWTLAIRRTSSSIKVFSAVFAAVVV